VHDVKDGVKDIKGRVKVLEEKRDAFLDVLDGAQVIFN
jgi:hypothetical protein